jgi:LuxR family maltose regulon positive regulatory protein
MPKRQHGSQTLAPLQAVRHAAAEDWALAARVLNSWFGLYLDGHSNTAYEYLAEFPSHVTETDPELIALMAARELNRGVLELADHYLGLALSKADTVPEERRQRLRVVLAVLRLSLARQRGDVPAAVKEAQLALEPEGVADAARLGLGEELRALTLLNLGFAEIEAFGIDEADQHLEQGLALARQINRPFLELTALSRLAATASFRSLTLSVARAREAIELAETHGWSGLPDVGLAFWAQAMCLVWQGRLDEAEPLLDLAEQRQQPEVEPAKAIAVLHTRAMVDLLRNRNEAAAHKLLAADRLAHRLGPGQVLTTMIQRWLLPTLAALGKTAEAEQALAELTDRQPADARADLARVGPNHPG